MKDTDTVNRLRLKFIEIYNQAPNLLIINDPEHPILQLSQLWGMSIMLDETAVDPFTVALKL